MEKIICSWVCREWLAPVMIGSNESTIIDHGQCVHAIGGDYIHNPEGVSSQSCCKAPIQSIHIHHVPYLVTSNDRKQFLVVLHSDFPLATVALEGTSSATGYVRHTFRGNAQTLWPLWHRFQTQFLQAPVWHCGTGSKRGVPSSIRLHAVIALGWISIRASKLFVVAAMI
uniref:Uncharacterized protein n=1 Tax=Opuntia streptacantha TaxID=393608 RepID=A0A7C8YY10_OPUST